MEFARFRRHALFGALVAMVAASPAAADPTLIYSTYLGGSRGDGAAAVAARAGDTFVAGTTYSLDFPLVNASFSSKPSDPSIVDIFVTKLRPSGAPFYSTYVQTTADNKFIVGIGVGPDGGAVVVSETFYGADALIDVVKLTGSGAVAWGREAFGRIYAQGMTVDSQGNVYITGHDNSEDAGSQYVDRAFVWKIGPDRSTIYWASIDGNNFEGGYGVAADAAGDAYVTGITLSTNLPEALQAPPAGNGYNVFVTKLDPAGAVQWSTYLGGSGEDWGREIAVAADGTVVVAGTTKSPNFPTLNAIQTGLHGTQDLFVARLQPWGSRISSTYLGGSGIDELKDLALDTSSILLAVASPDADSPLRVPLAPSCSTTFVAKLDATASRVLDASCGGNAVAVDSTGVSVAGSASSGLPVINAWQPAPAGGTDAFAQKLAFNHPPSCSAATASPNTFWPADGRFFAVSISGVTDVEGDPVTIALTSIFQDEWFTFSGMPDASGLGTSTARLRASRLNGGNGRVYHLRFTATDPQGAACASNVTVCVPPTQGGTCIDGGERVDSTRAY
jgi:hypothetical protein